MWPFSGFSGFGPWASYQGQPGQAYMQGMQANNMAQGFPSNTAIAPPSNPFQNLTQTQQAAALANASLAGGGTGAIPGQTNAGQGNFIDNLSKMFGGGQQGGAGGGFNWQQMLAQGAPRLANGQPLGQGGAPAPMLPQGQAPLTPGLLANVAASRQPLMSASPPNAANNFGGMGLQNYMMMRGMLGQ